MDLVTLLSVTLEEDLPAEFKNFKRRLASEAPVSSVAVLT